MMFGLCAKLDNFGTVILCDLIFTNICFRVSLRYFNVCKYR